MIRKPKIREILKKKEVEKGKEVQLEKGDFLSLVLAAFSVFLPIVLLFCLGIAIFIWLFFTFFHN